MRVPPLVPVALGVLLACAAAVARQWQDDCTFSPSAENAVSADCQFRSIEVRGGTSGEDWRKVNGWDAR